MSDLIEFLLRQLPEEEWWCQLDEHHEKWFAYQYQPECRPGDLWGGHEPGCAVCTRNPSKYGEVSYGKSWIEAWPCRHLCRLAVPYGDQPGFHTWWHERLGYGAQVT